VKMKIYVEGGGDKAKPKRECRRAFGKFFGQTFKPNSLPQNNDIESIPKHDLFEGLK